MTKPPRYIRRLGAVRFFFLFFLPEEKHELKQSLLRMQFLVFSFSLFFPLVHLLLLVDAELSRAAVNEQEETTDNG